VDGEVTMSPAPVHFITPDFLLSTPSARTLYHAYAADEPIFDYHCHLSPEVIASNRPFSNLTQIWLGGDHYKWRAMRANGIAEEYITGSASDEDKFLAWARTVPRCLRNPLYHWTHLELKRPFGIDDRLLDEHSASEIWSRCNELLGSAGFTPRGIMERMQVRVVCTTDDPTDDLAHHAAIAADPSCAITVRPTWRPDRAMAVEEPRSFNAWVDRLAAAADTSIGTFTAFLSALRKRHDAFHAMGCRLSDHGLETIDAEPYHEWQIERIFATVRAGHAVSPADQARFRSAMLMHGARWDHERGWVQQFHLGAMRNTNTRMRGILGPDTGYDSISDASYARPLVAFLDRLDRDDQLAKTILYNLNPKDNEVLASMIGSFQGGGIPGKMQFGSGWWFLDQKDGMEKQIDALSNLGLLSRFIGMLTDSRSFLSYTRHEYFRRVLCNLLGREMEDGLLPNDMGLVGGMVRDICYANAKAYIPIGEVAAVTKHRAAT
jgi:glucuronate isomerase